LKGSGASGSGAQGAGGGAGGQKTTTRSSFESMSPSDQMAHIKGGGAISD
jgi:hypothetical protein